MSENTATVPLVATLERLVGRWQVTGGSEGTVTYRWMDGRHFLIQDVVLDQYGQPITGLEVIGQERPFGAERPSDDIKSRYYSSGGDTLDYVYELQGNTLTIWSGYRGSPAYYRGELNADSTRMTGAWVFPGGGGYESNMTRLDEAGA